MKRLSRHWPLWLKWLSVAVVFCAIMAKPKDMLLVDDVNSVYFLAYNNPQMPQKPKTPAYLPDEIPEQPVVSEVVDLPMETFIHLVDQYYHQVMHTKEKQWPNQEIDRLQKFAVTYDFMSRLRYKRGVERYQGQKEIEDLVYKLEDTQWYDDYILRITENQDYSYSENRALRILASMHTGAHFFELPYPTLFCLLFQESKFDFKAFSHTGARGLGQLTVIGLRQIQEMRKKEIHETRLQNAVNHLRLVYSDEMMHKVLQKMGFNPRFPYFKQMPDQIQLPKFNTSLMREVGQNLVKNGYSYGNDLALVSRLAHQVGRGYILPSNYAPIHSAFIETIDQKYARHFGNVLNIETNVLFSSMLLRYYMNYRWVVGGKAVAIRPPIRAIFAIAAYNHGQLGVIRYIRKLKRDVPGVNLRTMSVDDFMTYFTQQRVAAALQDSPQKVRESFKHVRKILTCAQESPNFLE